MIVGKAGEASEAELQLANTTTTLAKVASSRQKRKSGVGAEDSGRGLELATTPVLSSVFKRRSTYSAGTLHISPNAAITLLHYRRAASWAIVYITQQPTPYICFSTALLI